MEGVRFLWAASGAVRACLLGQSVLVWAVFDFDSDSCAVWRGIGGIGEEALEKGK